MSHFTYVATVHKSTAVTHSDVGSFTDENDSNLIVAKHNHIEIYKISGESRLQLLKDLPVNGTVATLKLLRPDGKPKDYLFLGIVTIKSRFKFYLLCWDACAKDVITSDTHDVSDDSGVVTEKTCIFNHDCNLVLLRTRNDSNKNCVTLFKLINVDDKVHFIEEFKLWLFYQDILFEYREKEFLDIKLVFDSGSPTPTLAILFKGGGVKTYRVVKNSDGDNSDGDNLFGDSKLVEGPWFSSTWNSAEFLIPVPPPWGGVLAVGDKRILYCSEHWPIDVNIKDGLNREYARFRARDSLGLTYICDPAYERVGADGLRYLFSDQSGQLLLLVLTHNDKKVTELKLYPLGETSIAATLSYFHDGLVFVGSSFGDSQLVRLNLQPDSEGSYTNLQVLENYVNLGPVTDLCVTESQVQELVTCSGGFKCGSLRVIRKDFQLDENAFTNIIGVGGIWALKLLKDDQYDKFLVVNIHTETIVYAISPEDEVLLEVTDIPSFDSLVPTLLCHNAIGNLIVQVTPTLVRLVCLRSGELRNVWNAPDNYKIHHASARSTRVLLATGGGRLYFLEIIDDVLTLIKEISLEPLDEIVCLDVGLNENNPSNTKYAAVGTLKDRSVRIFSLPELTILNCDEVHEEFWPRCILLCVLEGISYAFCATMNGCVVYFMLDTTTGELTNKKTVSVCTRPTMLKQFSLENTTYVFVAADTPTIIYSSFQNLNFSCVKHEAVNQICYFSCSTVPNSLAIATNERLNVETFSGLIRSIYLGEEALCICHQKKSKTYTVSCINYTTDKSNRSRIHLFDDSTFEIIDTFELEGKLCPSKGTVYGCSIISCVFLEDDNEYVCVGTAIPSLLFGHILVFNVEDQKLKLISKTSNKLGGGCVYCLIAFKGMLLAGRGESIELFRWMLLDDGKRELSKVCECRLWEPAFCVQIFGDVIFSGSRMRLMIYQKADSDDESREEKSLSDVEEPQQKRIKPTEIKAVAEEERSGEESSDGKESSDGEESADGEEFSDDEEPADGEEFPDGEESSNGEESSDKETEEVDDKSSEEVDEPKTTKKKKDEESLEVVAIYVPKTTSVTAVDIFNTTYVGATTSRKLLTLRRSKGAGCRLQVVGRYRLGEKVTRFRHGPVVLGDQVPTSYFSTTSGAVGIVALLPVGGPYDIFDRLQKLIIENEGSGRMGYKSDSQYLDGDVIYLFLGLDCNKKAQICQQLSISVEELEKMIKSLPLLV